MTLLEAQERLGGRIHSLLSPEIAAPVELGAEFIHGLGPELWELVGAANLATHEVPVQQWRFENGHLVQDDSSFEDFEKLIKLADAAGPDMPFSSFLESHPDRRK